MERTLFVVLARAQLRAMRAALFFLLSILSCSVAAAAPAPDGLTLLATGTGEVSAADGVYHPAFELWGHADGFQIVSIRFNANDTPFEIALTVSSDGGRRGSGLMTPCEDGVCPCSLEGDEDAGWIAGFCGNSAHPEHGEFSFRVQINDHPAPTQQWVTLASGPGVVVAQGETRAASFEILGDDEQAWLVRMDMQGTVFEIALVHAEVGGSQGVGQLSPCDGGDCPCTMTEIEGGIEGLCSNRAYPEHGDMRFTMGMSGQQSPPTQAVAPPTPAQALVPQPPAGESVPASVKLSLQGRPNMAPNIISLNNWVLIYLEVTTADGTAYPIQEYERNFSDNVVFDDVSGDPNDLITVVYHNFSEFGESGPGRFGRLRPTGKGVGTATLKVSFRDAPGVTAAVIATVVEVPASVSTPVPATPPPAGPKVPVSVELSLQSNTIITRTSYFQKTYNGPGKTDPAIYIYVTFSDGSRIGPHDYQQQFAGNLVFDDTSGDPNGLIEVRYWDLNEKLPPSSTPGPGRFPAQLSAPGYATGNATLKVSLRNAPGISASIPVTVVGAPAPKAAPPPPPVAQAPTPKPTPAQPQLVLLATGSGDFNDAGAEFGIWGLNGDATQIRIQSGGGNYVLQIDRNSSNSDALRGRLTPCSGDGCSCEVIEEGQNYYMGFCDAADQRSENSFSFRTN